VRGDQSGQVGNQLETAIHSSLLLKKVQYYKINIKWCDESYYFIITHIDTIHVIVLYMMYKGKQVLRDCDRHVYGEVIQLR